MQMLRLGSALLATVGATLPLLESGASAASPISNLRPLTPSHSLLMLVDTVGLEGGLNGIGDFGGTLSGTGDLDDSLGTVGELGGALSGTSDDAAPNGSGDQDLGGGLGGSGADPSDSPDSGSSGGPAGGSELGNGNGGTEPSDGTSGSGGDPGRDDADEGLAGDGGHDKAGSSESGTSGFENNSERDLDSLTPLTASRLVEAPSFRRDPGALDRAAGSPSFTILDDRRVFGRPQLWPWHVAGPDDDGSRVLVTGRSQILPWPVLLPDLSRQQLNWSWPDAPIDGEPKLPTGMRELDADEEETVMQSGWQ